MKRISQIAVAAAGLALAGSAFARYTQDPYYFDYARVVRVDRIIGSETQPVTREECWTEPANHPEAGYHGNSLRIENTRVSNDGVVRNDVVSVPTSSEPEYQQKCRERTEFTETPQVVAYDVVYTYHNQDYHDRMNHDPGAKVRVMVQDGYVQVDDE